MGTQSQNIPSLAPLRKGGDDAVNTLSLLPPDSGADVVNTLSFTPLIRGELTKSARGLRTFILFYFLIKQNK